MKILIPTPLRPYAEKKDLVEVGGRTVDEGLSQLTSRYPDLRRHLYGEEGKLRAFVNVYVNDDDIRYLNQEHTPVQDGDTLSIVPSIAGGCCCYGCCR
ncbi:MAG TPA: MoaD/ThiS family protein [Terriglobales bacterium]|nr:MoaD/ThiS family protein [Terriglobales bacterium]